MLALYAFASQYDDHSIETLNMIVSDEKLFENLKNAGIDIYELNNHFCDYIRFKRDVTGKLERLPRNLKGMITEFDRTTVLDVLIQKKLVHTIINIIITVFNILEICTKHINERITTAGLKDIIGELCDSKRGISPLEKKSILINATICIIKLQEEQKVLSEKYRYYYYMQNLQLFQSNLLLIAILHHLCLKSDLDEIVNLFTKLLIMCYQFNSLYIGICLLKSIRYIVEETTTSTTLSDTCLKLASSIFGIYIYIG
jgi:hypothetical protein